MQQTSERRFRTASGRLVRWHYVYALLDPTSEEIRYVGITCEPEKRLLWHCFANRRAVEKRAWILSLPRLPILRLLAARQSRREARDLEALIIKTLVAEGARLLNKEHVSCSASSSPTSEPERAPSL